MEVAATVGVAEVTSAVAVDFAGVEWHSTVVEWDSMERHSEAVEHDFILPDHDSAVAVPA